MPLYGLSSSLFQRKYKLRQSQHIFSVVKIDRTAFRESLGAMPSNSEVDSNTSNYVT